MGVQRNSQFGHRPIRVTVPLLCLTCISTRYTPEPARPMLGSSGWGGAGSSAPGISCKAGSSQAVENTCSTRTSWVFGPAAARKCFNMVRQYSSDQSCSTLETRKMETSSCRAGCGVKKSWPCEPKSQPCRSQRWSKLTNLGASRGQIRLLWAYSPSSTVRQVILSGIHHTLGSPRNQNARTSTASCTTGARSWTTKRRCGWCLASAKDTAPTPPPTSTISEPSGSCPQAYPADVSNVRSWCSKVTQPERTFENDLGWVHILHAIHASPESGKTQSVPWRLEPGPYVFLDIVCSVKGSLV